MILVAAVGIVATFQARMLIDPILPLGLFFLYLMPFLFGWIAAAPPPRLEGFAPAEVGSRNLIAGAIAGLISGVLLALLLVLMTSFDLRGVFIELSPELAEILSFGQPLGVAIPLIVAISTAAGVLGGAVHLLPPRLRRALMSALVWVIVFSLMTDLFGQLFNSLNAEFITTWLYGRAGGPLTIGGAITLFVLFLALYWYLGGQENTMRQRVQAMPKAQRSRWQIGAAVVILVVLYFIPKLMGPFVSQILVTAGIYLLMALGLNIVVGYAGLLDLGYVAFFAVGAYTTAILTSPQSPAFAPEISVIAALPFVMIAAAVAGILVATPVIRMRGDYLAIVTLGFGEIARILLNSEWLAPVFGGAQGITNVPGDRAPHLLHPSGLLLPGVPVRPSRRIHNPCRAELTVGSSLDGDA
jgi:branched-chain amino acid transport system permease protein